MTEIAERIKINIDNIVPQQKHVVLHNDHHTSMEFVISVLIGIFEKTSEQAFDLMMKVHEEGEAVVGTYFSEIADTKVGQVHTAAMANSYPLKASTRPA